MIAERTDTSAPLELTVSDQNGQRSGLVCVVALRDATSTTRYLDFADLTLKTSGWTTKKALLTEIAASPGVYFLTTGLNINGITNLGAIHQLVAEYEIPSVATTNEIITIVNHIYDIAIPGDAMGLIADAVDSDAVAASGAAEIAAAFTLTLSAANLNAIAASVWNAAITSFQTAGSTGKILNDVHRTDFNRLEIDVDTQELILYGDSGTTVVQRWPIQTNNGEPVKAFKNVQTKRKAPTL